MLAIEMQKNFLRKRRGQELSMKEKQPFKAPGHESFPIKKLKAKRG
jgi:hypothetical protein